MTDFEFAFAFNSINFSDRLLRIEIISSDDSNSDSDSDSICKVVKVETLHISSAILAAKSPFFYKLFINGMRESHQKHLTLRINAYEKAPLMDLLKFVYTNSLSAIAAADLLDVLMAADKYEVASCMRYCSLLLKELPMSLDSAHFYLELPSSALMAEAIQPLTDAAKQYLAPIYKLQEEAMALTLSDVEVVLGSDDVQVQSEDCVFDFILKWIRAHYPKQEERREILTKSLVWLIRFPYMSYWKLKDVLASVDHGLDHELVSKLVREAFSFQAGLPYGECTRVVEECIDPTSTFTNRRLSERIYEHRPVKVMHFKQPYLRRCLVYFTLKKDECANLFPSKLLYSQPFPLAGKGFRLVALCNKGQHFGLFVFMGKGKKTCTFSYEFEVMEKSSEEFRSKYKVDNCTLTKGKFSGKENLFEIPWTDFMSDGSDYFIDGVLQLRAELTLNFSRA